MSRNSKNNLSKPADEKHSFFDSVFEVVKQIPKGRVSSYGAIANYVGSRLSARMVGWAMNASHLSDKPIPAHRVVNRMGLLTGKNHFSTPDAMQQLLEGEGIKVLNDQVQDFQKLFWDPSIELTSLNKKEKSSGKPPLL